MVEPNEGSVELRAGQMMSLPAAVITQGFSAAITSNGDLYCWGYNRYGQVGNGTTTNQSTPVKVLEQVASVSVSASVYGAIAAIKSNGDLYCWGYNAYGQVGNGTTTNQSTPVKVLEQVASVSVSGYGTMAAIKSNGDLYCWGANDYGRVGNGTTITNQSTPVKVLEQVASVSVSGYGTMAAIKSNGDLYCWGRNNYGQVGNGTTTNQSIPVKVLEQVASVSSVSTSVFGYGCGTMAAIKSNGDLYCWGYNRYGQVGNGTATDQSTPVKVLEQVASVSVSGYGTMAAIKSNGDLYCWGYNGYGQVGNGTATNQSTPVKVLEQITSVYVSGYISGYGTMAAIKSNGDLYCWGYNGYGQVGNGTTTNQSTPVKVLEQVSFVSDSGFDSSFGSGVGTMTAIKSNGDLYCWGYNDYGQVGNGTTTNQSTPVKVLEQVSSVSDSGFITMAAIKSNGDLYCWGYNNHGEVGDGTTTDRHEPVKIMNLSNGSLNPSLDDDTEDPTDNSIASFTLDKTASGTLPGNDITISGKLTLSGDAAVSVDVMESQISGITWKSSDSSVAKVTDCMGIHSVDNRQATLLITVALHKAGTTIITGTTSNGLTASCEITVPKKADQNTEFVTVTGGSTYYYWDNHLYDKNDRICDSIPLQITVNNITEKDMKDISITVNCQPGLCFDNKKSSVEYESENLAVGEQKIFQLNLSLDDFDNKAQGKTYSSPISVYLYGKDGQDIYTYRDFKIDISYLFDFYTDNFSFLNVDESFWNASNEKDKYYISKEAKRKISLINYLDITTCQDLSNITGWDGSCFGMSSVAASAFAGIISSKQFGEDCIGKLKSPAAYALDGNTLLRDTINILQCSNTTLTHISNQSLLKSQKELAEKIVTELKRVRETSQLPVVDFKIYEGTETINHAVVPYSISENENEYNIWIYDPNYDFPRKMTISRDYKTVKYRGENIKKIRDVITNPEVIDISTYAPGLLPESNHRSAAERAYASENTKYDFTAVLIDTSKEVMLSNSSGQTLRVKGEEILGGDMVVRDVSYLADMGDQFALVVLENDSTGVQELQIQSNADNKITAFINNNYNIGFINTEGDRHTATYSSEGEISVRSNGKIAGEVSYSNLELIKNTDVFGVSLSGNNTSNMDIIAKGEAVKVYSDNLKNMDLTMKRKGEDYYVTDFPLENMNDSSTGVEITESGNDIVLNGTDTAIPTVTVKPSSPTPTPTPQPSQPAQKRTQALNLKYGLNLKRPVGSKLTQRASGTRTPVTFTSSNPKVARIHKTIGKITCVGVGTAVITAKAAESSQYKAASKKVTLTVVPKKVGVKSVTSKKKGQAVVKSGSTAKGNDGYQIQYRNNGRTKTIKIMTGKALTKTLKGLKSGKSLKVRIRAYKRVNGKTYFGNYSSWKTLKRVR